MMAAAATSSPTPSSTREATPASTLTGGAAVAHGHHARLDPAGADGQRHERLVLAARRRLRSAKLIFLLYGVRTVRSGR
ncbi:MAG: hypothetical protein U0470_10595 [Anaerolineae bacterium]